MLVIEVGTNHFFSFIPHRRCVIRSNWDFTAKIFHFEKFVESEKKLPVCFYFLLKNNYNSMGIKILPEYFFRLKKHLEYHGFRLTINSAIQCLAIEYPTNFEPYNSVRFLPL